MQDYNHAIREWPVADRPRERLLKHGEHTLSDSELLAILLRTGVKGQSAIDLGRAILTKFKTFRQMSHTDESAWRDFKGIGPAKIAQIRAAIEIGRRFGEQQIDQATTVSSARDIADILMPRMRDLKKEVFKVVLLTSQNAIIDVVEMVQGTVNQAAPVVREIFEKALQTFAAAIVCIHNHPSGNTEPSEADRAFTQQLVDAGKALQIKVLDHIVIGDNAFCSFAERGWINP